MSLHSDFILFVDGGSLFKYYDKNCTYYPKPLNFIDFFEFDYFKQFYKTSSGCYLGLSCEKFVRKISVNEFNRAKFLYLKELENSLEVKKRVQLVLF